LRHIDTGQLIATEEAGCRSVCPFTDDPIQTGVTPVRAIHVSELRTRIDALRERHGLSLPEWTDASLAGVVVKAAHITELRRALADVYVASRRAAPTFADPDVSVGMLIKTDHIVDLRAAIEAIE
jgi:hypothetical protein